MNSGSGLEATIARLRVSIRSIHYIEYFSRIGSSHWILCGVDSVLLGIFTDREASSSSQVLLCVEDINSFRSSVSSLVVSDVALALSVDHLGATKPCMCVDGGNRKDKAQYNSDARHFVD